MKQNYCVPQGQFYLRRLPEKSNDFLQAYDAADRYLLEYIHEHLSLSKEDSIAVFNDAFGALTVALFEYQPCVVTDSFLAKQAILRNLDRNGLDQAGLTLQDCQTVISSPLRYVFLKIPKTLALLEYQLISIRPFINSDTTLIATGMMKNLSASVWKVFEHTVGPTSTSLALKKAKLIHVTVSSSTSGIDNPYPSSYRLEGKDWLITNHANVFSRERLDIGTRFLLDILPQVSEARRYIDLGCGNGIVGISLAVQSPDSKVTFIDESYMAVDSARINFETVIGNCDRGEFIVNDALTDMGSEIADCIVCNPPFHQSHVIGDFIARRMFHQAKKALTSKGEFWVIGNRHLKYHTILNGLFEQCDLVAHNPKFMIYRCQKN